MQLYRTIPLKLVSLLVLLPQQALAATWIKTEIPNCKAASTVIATRTGVYVGGAGQNSTPTIWRYAGGVWTKVIEVKDGGAGYFSHLVELSDGSVFAAKWASYTGKWRLDGALSNTAKTHWNTISWNEQAKRDGIVYISAILHGTNLLVTGADSVDGKTLQGFVSEFGKASQITTDIRYNPKSHYLHLVAFPPTGSAGAFTYVAGRYKESPTAQPGEGVALWSYAAGGFNQIALPTRIQEINELQIALSGRLYIGGRQGRGTDGRVWVYVNGGFNDSLLSSRHVASLASASDGSILAGGIGPNFKGGVWRLNDQLRKFTGWQDLSLPDSKSVHKIVSYSGQIVVLGANNDNKPSLWIGQ